MGVERIRTVACPIHIPASGNFFLSLSLPLQLKGQKSEIFQSGFSESTPEWVFTDYNCAKSLREIDAEFHSVGTVPRYFLQDISLKGLGHQVLKII